MSNTTPFANNLHQEVYRAEKVLAIFEAIDAVQIQGGVIPVAGFTGYGTASYTDRTALNNALNAQSARYGLRRINRYLQHSDETVNSTPGSGQQTVTKCDNRLDQSWAMRKYPRRVNYSGIRRRLKQ